MNDIITEFEERQEPTDEGVERVITAEEEYVAYGERIERTTELALLEGGGVHISQRIPGCHDTLTLASDVLWRLRWEAGRNDGPEHEQLADALFETLAALSDLREQLVGGAQRSGVSSEQVVERVWNAYDLGEASDLLAETGHRRDDTADPSAFGVSHRVAADNGGGADGE